MPTKNIKVYCSSANLGPGFDVVGLGLSLYLNCVLTYYSPEILIKTDNESITTNPLENLITKTVQFVANVYSKRISPYHISITSDIPLSRGLGSSASAIVLGILIASEILNLPLSKEEITDLGTIIEGHPDNVSASVYGGLTVSFLRKELPEFQEDWFSEGTDLSFLRDDIGKLTATSVLEMNKSVKITCVIPDFELSTSKARAVLPSLYPRSSLIHNMGRTSFFISQITLQHLNIPLLKDSFGDVIHQPYRASLIPGLKEVLDMKGQSLLGVCLSGAGPTVIIFHLGEYGDVKQVFKKHGVESKVVDMTVSNGYVVETVEE